MAVRYAVDTNVLLRLSHQDHPQHELISTALHRLVERGVELCFYPAKPRRILECLYQASRAEWSGPVDPGHG